MSFALLLFLGGAPLHMASFPSAQDCLAAVNHNMPRVRHIGHLGCISENNLKKLTGG